jgi:uncharacterized protein DUF1996
MQRSSRRIAVAVLLLVGLVPLSSGADVQLPVFLRKRQSGVFISMCRLSHRAPDDPIVKFGQPGASHLHDFFGNTTTNAYSNYRTLRQGHTTCNNRPDDAAGYWVPSLLLNGQLIQAYKLNAYYTTGGKDRKSIRSFPPGLMIVAGDSKATTAQSTEIVSWSCYHSKAPPQSTVPTCKEDEPLRLSVRFPDCWNGQSLDFVDHKSHMAYSSHGSCPSGYPVPVPSLEFKVLYPVSGSGVTLSSGSALTGHGDFFNAWKQKELDYLVRECLQERRDCKSSEPGLHLPYEIRS